VNLETGPFQERLEPIPEAVPSDAEALDRIYEHHAPLVRQFLRSKGCDLPVEDLVQETFLRVWAKRSRYRGDAGLGTYLIVAIAEKVVLEHLWALSRSARDPRARPFHPVDQPAPIPGLSSPASPVESRVCLNESRDHLGKAIAALPLIYRQAVQLGFLTGLSKLEAAEQAGCKPPAFRMRLSRALTLLRQRLSDGV
jgi:RNA polymerase sigma-70 factor (ECF subfamily)